MGKDDFIWAFMPQFGMNMFVEIVQDPPARDGIITKTLTDEEYEKLLVPGYSSHESIRFDENLWRRLADRLKADGCNFILIDVGEFVVYPSHPELAVKGSWTPERMRDEVRRLRAMGFKVAPKLNFSCCHDAWLKEYSRMVSTPQYYQVVQDLIHDVYEIFEKPEYIHLGLDEEDIYEYQSRGRYIVRMRMGELWWHDVLFMIGEVEKHGARAWMWSDYIRRNPVEDFVKRMPRSVVQSPWTYRTETPTFDDPLINIFKTLTDAGFDTIPCGSNCYGLLKNFAALAKFCKDNLDPAHFKGMIHAPWIQTRVPYDRKLFEASTNIAEAIAACK